MFVVSAFINVLVLASHIVMVSLCECDWPHVIVCLYVCCLLMWIISWSISVI